MNTPGQAASTTPVTDDKLWDQAQKDRASAKSHDASADTTVTPAAPAPAVTPPAPESTPAAAASTPAAMTTPSDDPYAGLPESTKRLIEGIEVRTRKTEQELVTTRRQLDTAHGTIGKLKQDLTANQERLTTMTPVVDSVAADRKAADEGKLQAQRKAVESARAKLKDLLEPEEIDALFPLPPEKPAQAATPQPAPAATTPAPTPQATPTPQPAARAASADPAPEVVIALQEAMDIAHPGWLKTRETPEFKAWFNAAPADVKALAESWSAKDTAKIFDAFKKHQQDAATVSQVEKDRQDRLRRGEAPQGRGSATPGAPPSGDALWDQAKRDRAAAKESAAA